ncbi:MAG: ABC transporter substrate-binding protein [Thermoplasmatales archaeon]|jgi:ABC-type transport system substrate-binding protein|nr:ABC transporter substrate-binding protein [Candidatus Thermoplasmatota archaeon]MDA8054477.1 ABC transporter substrate-binding protein [Thermoplasmatales archaeon]
MTQSEPSKNNVSPKSASKRWVIPVVVVVVVIVVVAAIALTIPRSTSPTSLSLSAVTSSNSPTVNQSVTFTAQVTGGSPSGVLFNFGDGTTGSAALSNGKYTISHSYEQAGNYLVTANTTLDGKTANNLNNIMQIVVSPTPLSPSLAPKTTQTQILLSSQLYTAGDSVLFTGANLELPTASNWTIGYFIWNFGNGNSKSDYALQNETSGNFLTDNVSVTYSQPGVYPVTLGLVTFNSTGYTSTTTSLKGYNYSYYPLSDLNTILSSSNFVNNTYTKTIVVGQSGQSLKIGIANNTTTLKTITVAEVTPGGPFSFDPAIAPSTIDLEPIQNVYEPLIAYNGSSSNIIPVVASQVPSTSNGLLSSNGMNYTFPIRQGIKFSNGDPLAAWDVYTSMVRDLLLTQGVPSTNGFLIASDLLPGGGFAAGSESYQNITSAITVDNSTQTVTFHLLVADPAFLTYFASLWGTQIMDYNWLSQHGQNITFTPAGFQYYTRYGLQANYNNYVRYGMMGSGPYMVGSYILGQSILLVPNPNFIPISGIPGFNHSAKDDVQIYWVLSDETALLMLKSGQANVVVRLPSSDYPAVTQMMNQGKLNVTSFNTEKVYFFAFNFNINETMMRTFGSQFSVPSAYFANPDVRLAFAYAFNYTNYIDNLLGNKVYGINFGSGYTGLIPNGMPGYKSPSQLQNVPQYDIAMATQYMQQSGNYSTQVNIPIIVWSGDLTDYAAASMWAQALHTMDPNIQATPIYQPFASVEGYAVPGANPMPLYLWDWNPPWNYPTATMSFLYLAGEYGGYLPPANGIDYGYLNSIGYTAEAQQWDQLNNYTLAGISANSTATALNYFDMGEQMAINMTMYVYLYQSNGIYITTPGIQGMNWEMNPLTNSATQMFYNYLSLT